MTPTQPGPQAAPRIVGARELEVRVRHAAELQRLRLEQHNALLALQEKHRGELAELADPKP